MSEEKQEGVVEEATGQAVETPEEKLPVEQEHSGDEASPQEAGDAPEVRKARFEDLDPGSEPVTANRLDMLMDVLLPVSVELGRSKMLIKDILELNRGSVIELDKLAGEPVDLLINDKKLAEGEVVVVEKQFGIRITNLVDPASRLKSIEAK